MAKAAMKPETKAEAVARQVADQLDPPPHYLLVELPGGNYRAATLVERAEAETRRQTLGVLEAQLRDLEAQRKGLEQQILDIKHQCPHTVSYDTDGWDNVLVQAWIYIDRWCYGCGKWGRQRRVEKGSI